MHAGEITGMRDIVQSVAQDAVDAGVFATVEAAGAHVECAAAGAPEPAFYRITAEDDGLWVSFVTPNRWLSQSIEADLMFTGDDLTDLVDEELADQGFDGGPLEIQHFRDEEMLYTFRSKLPVTPTSLSNPDEADDARRIARAALLAYEAVFRELGDMKEGAGED